MKLREICQLLEDQPLNHRLHEALGSCLTSLCQCRAVFQRYVSLESSPASSGENRLREGFGKVLGKRLLLWRVLPAEDAVHLSSKRESIYMEHVYCTLPAHRPFCVGGRLMWQLRGKPTHRVILSEHSEELQEPWPEELSSQLSRAREEVEPPVSSLRVKLLPGSASRAVVLSRFPGKGGSFLEKRGNTPIGSGRMAAPDRVRTGSILLDLLPRNSVAQPIDLLSYELFSSSDPSLSISQGLLQQNKREELAYLQRKARRLNDLLGEGVDPSQIEERAKALGPGVGKVVGAYTRYVLLMTHILGEIRVSAGALRRAGCSEELLGLLEDSDKSFSRRLEHFCSVLPGLCSHVHSSSTGPAGELSLVGRQPHAEHEAQEVHGDVGDLP